MEKNIIGIVGRFPLQFHDGALIATEDKLVLVRGPLPIGLLAGCAALCLLTLVMMFADKGPIPGWRFLNIPIPLLLMIGVTLYLLWEMTGGRRSRLDRLNRIKEALLGPEPTDDKLRGLMEGAGATWEAVKVTAAEWDPIGGQLQVRVGRFRLRLKVAENHAQRASELVARCQEWGSRSAGRR